VKLASILRLAAALGGIAATAADADGPYKCAGIDRVPVYQQQPCDAGRELRNLADSPSSVSVIPFAQPASPTPPSKAAREKAVKAATKEKPRHSGDASERRHVKEGMTEGEVLSKLGAPDLQSGRARLMRWTYLPTPADVQTVTVVRFEDGKVTNVDRRILR
jgi:hypothetical protein